MTTNTAVHPDSARTQPVIAASYERVSTRQQGQFGFSLAAQHQSLEEFAAAQGWELPERLRFRDGEDADASGTRWDLPGLNAMLDSARRGEFSVLVVPDLDRFARTLVKGLVLEEQLKKYGVRVVYQRVPVDDSPEGRLLKNQLFSYAEYEREKFILRSLSGRREKARQGQVVGQSVAPFGYRYVYGERGTPVGLEPDPATAPIVQEIFERLRTQSAQQVADWLNATGVPTARGRRWSARAVWRIAVSPTYVGEWRFGGQGYDRRLPPEARGGIVVPVPPLVDRATWETVQAALTRRRSARRGRTPEADPFLLRGLLTCGHCHGVLSVNTIGGRRYYQCLRHIPKRAERLGKPVCDLPFMLAEPLEAEVWAVLETTLLDEDYLAAGLEAARAARAAGDPLRRERLEVIDREVARLRRQLDRHARRLAELDDDGELAQAVERAARETERLIERHLAERAELERAAREPGLSDAEVAAITDFARTMREGLAEATPAERRELVERLALRGTVRRDPQGIRLGRRTRVDVAWTAAIPLRRNSETAPTRMGMPS